MDNLKSDIVKKNQAQERNGTAESAKKIEKRLMGYACNRLFRRHNELIAEVIRQINPRGNSFVLDVGCGQGSLIEYLSIVGHRCVGLDPNPVPLNYAFRRIRKKSFLVQGEAEYSPYSSNIFDVVTLRGVIHHLASPEASFAEIKRLLKSGGHLIIFEGNPNSMYRSAVLRLAKILGISHEVSPFPHCSGQEIVSAMPKEMPLIEKRSISGLFAPLALSGVNWGKWWLILEWIEDNLFPANFFPWYNLMVFKKEN